MKILIVSPTYLYPYYASGLNVINFNLIENNTYFKADILCLFREEDKQYFHEENQSVKYYKIPVKEEILKFRAILNSFIFGLSYNVAKKKKNILLLKSKLFELAPSYDRIHFSSYYSMLLLSYLPKEILIKSIAFPVDSTSLLERRFLKNKTGINKIIALLNLNRIEKYEKKILKYCKQNLFVSEVDSNYVAKKYNLQNTSHIHNGVDISKFYFSNKKENVLKLIFTANFSYKPNKEAAVFLIEKVLPLIYSQRKDIYLNFVGINPLYPFHGANFTFTGRVDDIRTFLNESLLYIVPLFLGTGIKNKILEAMSMGKIVIGSKLSFDGINGYDKEHFLIVKDDLPETWANFILEVIENAKNYLHIKKNARQLIVENYSWQLIQKKYKEVYQK